MPTLSILLFLISSLSSGYLYPKYVYSIFFIILAKYKPFSFILDLTPK